MRRLGARRRSSAYPPARKSPVLASGAPYERSAFNPLMGPVPAIWSGRRLAERRPLEPAPEHRLPAAQTAHEPDRGGGLHQAEVVGESDQREAPQRRHAAGEAESQQP